MRTQSIVHGMIMGLFLGLYSVGAATVGEQCSNDFEKVATCLNYATGKAEAPTKECCASVTEIKDSDPVCLCYIIQQTHDGGEQVKSLGIQEARLLQLPTACKLTNASASNCPKLLNLTVSSPDYKFFTNISSGSSTTPTTTPSTTTGTSLPTTTTDGSNGPRNGPQLAGGLVSNAITIFFFFFFFCAYPLEVVSIF